MEFVQNDLCFEVINESEKTVKVKGTQALVDAEPRDIIVPATVKNNDVEYTVVAVGGTFSFQGNKKYWKEDSRRSEGGLWMDNVGTHSVRGFAYTKIKSITLPDTLTSICDYAFEMCKQLVAITIPCTVKMVGKNNDIWRYRCGCSTIRIQAKSIEEYCNCDINKLLRESGYNIASHLIINGEEVTNIVLPDTITNIPDDAFYNCRNITSITISNSVTSIGVEAFRDCIGLTSITIPNSITSIGERAFPGCTGLTSITIPNSGTSIGNSAFRGCSKLISITIPNSITSIGESAFYECKSLRFITIPKSVTSIGCRAFNDCYNLMSITVLPEDIMIGNEVFKYTQWWNNQPDGFVYLGKILLGYKGSRLDVQSAVDVKEGTTSIAANAFYGCTNMPAVNLPKSLKCIGGNAFSYCKMLTSISIPSSIIRIGNYIFSTNDKLTSLILTADSIEEYCKSGINEQLEKSYTGSRILKIKDEEVTEVVISDTVTSILPYAFTRIPGITSVKIPDSVTSIGERAFYQSTKLETLTLPSGIVTISKEAFCACSGLTSITIPNSVTTIEDSAFKNCKALTSITIPDSVTTIGAYALKDCDTLTSITIPYSVTTIGKGALGGCDKLDTIIIENTPENITFDFANNSDDNWISKVQFVGQPENVEQLKAAAAARVASAAQKAALKEAAAPAETPTAEPVPAPATPVAAQPAETPKPAAPTINLETLIAAALVDGIVTDKERSILCKKVKETGGDVDEFELLLDARIYEAQQKNNTIVEVTQTAPKEEPKTETPKEIVNQSAIPTIEQKKQDELTISNIATPKQPKSVSPTTTQTRNRDKANYVFNGKVYTKKVQLVQDLVLHHLSLHPDLTHEQLKKDFQVQKNMDVMFMSYEMYLSTLAEKGIVYFFESKTEEDTIALQDAKILISSNWPTMVGGKPSVFAKLLDKAKELGYEITVQD